MAFNTKIVKTLPFDQRHNYADRDIPPYPVQGNDIARYESRQGSSLSNFAARCPTGLTLVYIGWQGILWRLGSNALDHGAGQIQVCERGAEARWISTNAMQPHRLSVLRGYVYTYRMLDAASHLQYLQTRLRMLEAQLGVDVMGCKDGAYDSSFAGELLELIIEITEHHTFLRKINEKALDGPISGYSNAHLWVSCYQLDRLIDEYCYKRDAWLAMQARPEPEAQPEAQPIPESEPVKETQCEPVA